MDKNKIIEVKVPKVKSPNLTVGGGDNFNAGYSWGKLNNLSSNLVVIGGKNRAGKSTFLKLLRYLPFGLPRDNSIPPAKKEYYIEAELEKENKIYNKVQKFHDDIYKALNKNNIYKKSTKVNDYIADVKK